MILSFFYGLETLRHVGPSQSWPPRPTKLVYGCSFFEYTTHESHISCSPGMKISVEKVKEWTKGFQGGVTIWIDGWG